MAHVALSEASKGPDKSATLAMPPQLLARLLARATSRSPPLDPQSSFLSPISKHLPVQDASEGLGSIQPQASKQHGSAFIVKKSNSQSQMLPPPKVPNACGRESWRVRKAPWLRATRGTAGDASLSWGVEAQKRFP